MTDTPNLIERLRNRRYWEADDDPPTGEAATEIERLRANHADQIRRKQAAQAYVAQLRHTLTVIAEAAEEFDRSVDPAAFAAQTATTARSALSKENAPVSGEASGAPSEADLEGVSK